MRHLFTLRRGLAVAALACVVMPSSASADIELIFGAYTADKPTEVVKQFKPILTYLADDLTDRMGEPVIIKMSIARSYEEGNADLVSGKVDFARFGPASYIIAKEQNDGIGIIAMETKSGQKTTPGVIAIHADSDITALDQLDNHSFAFGDASSTIGRFLVQEQLLDAGITAQNLASFEYLGRHDRVGTAVGQGSFDAGALKESTFKKLQGQGIPIKALTTFPNVTKPWLHADGVDADVVAALKASMTSLKDAELLKDFSESGFVVGDDTDYAPIRTAMQRSQDFGG